LFRNWSHQTRVGLRLSIVASLLSIVVQGSGIGPIMFPLFIDELEGYSSILVLVKLFVVDVKIYLVMTVNDVTRGNIVITAL